MSRTSKNFVVVIVSMMATIAPLFNAFAEMPKNEVICRANVLETQIKLPKTSLQPAELILKPEQTEVSKSFNITAVTYSGRYAAFYAKYALQPRTEMGSFENNLVLSETLVPEGHLKMKISRFPEAENRMAGIALEVDLEKSFSASYLLDLKKLGAHHGAILPKTINGEAVTLSVTCELR